MADARAHAARILASLDAAERDALAADPLGALEALGFEGGAITTAAR